MTNERLAIAQHEDRKRYVGQAKAWTVAQAERLAIAPEDIDAAIRRGWLPNEVARVTHPAELLRRRR